MTRVGVFSFNYVIIKIYILGEFGALKCMLTKATWTNSKKYEESKGPELNFNEHYGDRI